MFVFDGNTYILMKDKTLKQIKDIEIGDQVIENNETGKSNVVCKVHKSKSYLQTYKIHKNTIGNTDDIICSDHPIFCNAGNNRIFAGKIKCVELYDYDEPLYNLQFEDEGTFYANGIMVDSLSPNHQFCKLSESSYINKEKYDKDLIVRDEDDSFRNKPPMTITYDDIVSLN